MGNLTFSHVNGLDIVREKVSVVRNPRTLEQLRQRCRFKLTVQLGHAFSQALALGMVGRPAALSPENMFVSINIGAVTVNDALEAEINFPALRIAKGNRAMPEDITLTHDAEAGTFTLKIEDEEFSSHTAPDDQFFCCVYERTKQRCKLFPLGERSKLAPSVLSLPKKWNSDPANLAFYVFCLSKNRKNAGNSVYVTVE